MSPQKKTSTAEKQPLFDGSEEPAVDNDFAIHQRLAQAPAVAIAVPFAAGIFLDQTLRCDWLAWLVGGTSLVLLWMVCFLRSKLRLGGCCLLMAAFFLGGARHHMAMTMRGNDEISLFARTEPKPVHLMGIVDSPPEEHILQSPRKFSPFFGNVRTTFRLHCSSLETQGNMSEVSGDVRVSVNGELPQIEVGDQIEVRGRFLRPGAPANPGQFDYRGYLERRGMRCVVYVDHAEAVYRITEGTGWSVDRWVSRLRGRCIRMFREHLKPENVPAASAILLGDRTEIDGELRAAFVASGTMHVLAISGLHLGILASILWFACRMLNLSTAKTSVLVVIFIIGYALLTGARPPVVRASILIGILAVGRAFQRESFGENSLAIAALVLLAWNPVGLFDAGTQLSFLAVAAILWSSRWQPRNTSYFATREEQSTSDNSGRFRRRIHNGMTGVIRAYLISAAVWMTVAPLIMDRFHIVSPVGLVINVLLIPVVAAVLWLGCGFLVVGLLVGAWAAPLGFAFDALLSGMLSIVEVAARLQLSHVYVPSIPAWWLVGYYLLLAGMVYWPRLRDSGLIRWGLLFAWVSSGLGLGLMPAQRSDLRCTVLSMGHGCSVVVELPNGRTILYDAGSLSGGANAQQRIEGALWELGISRLDAIVISHADVDHFNAIEGLVRSIPIGSLLAARSFLDFDQQSVRALCEEAAKREIPIRLISAGDRLGLDNEVELKVLHPEQTFRADDDNANSVVLGVKYSGRQILLPGDLEDEGREALLRNASRKIDVLLAPHHGGRNANTESLAQWAQHPDWVILSAGRGGQAQSIQKTYNRAKRIASTADSGAVRVLIDRRGVVHFSGYFENSD